MDSEEFQISEQTFPENEKLWKDEIGRRVKALNAGEMALFPASEVLARFRKIKSS